MEGLQATTFTVTCSGCDRSWETEAPVFMKRAIRRVLCDECQAAEVQRELKSRWQEICPKRYHLFDPDQFTGNSDLLGEALEWGYGAEGLVLHGYTGEGKTWAAMMIAEREFMSGMTVEIVDDWFLCRLMTAKGLSMDAYESGIKRLIRRDLVVLDDPFKGTLTESIQGALWSIINGRYNEARPVIVTMNGTPENIGPLLTDDRAAPLFERLRNSCQIIHFPKPKEIQ